MKKLDVPQSGSQASTTASRNRFGQYNRTRAMPTQPRTEAQTAVRANLSEVSRAWGHLSDADRSAWNGYAAAHPRTDSLGQTIVLTGHMMYVAVNVLNLQAGIAIQNAVPNGEVVHSITIDVDNEDADSLSILSVNAVPLASKILCYASPPTSQGRAFNGDYRLVKTLAGTNAAAQPILTAADLSAKFGTLAANQKFFLSFQVLHGGNTSTESSVTVVLQ